MDIKPSTWTTNVYEPYLRAIKKNDEKTASKLRWAFERIYKPMWEGVKDG